MPLGLANNVVQPATAGTPGWLHTLMLHGISIWNSHPIALADGTAWIQIGIGCSCWCPTARVGRVGPQYRWGGRRMIWLIGNGAGGIFQSSSNILFGWPGATFFYAVAGVWLALSPANFPERFSRITLRLVAVHTWVSRWFAGAALGGFWHGGNTNALTAMTQSMVQDPSTPLAGDVVTKFGVLAGTLGGGFNLIVIFWLAASAVGLWMAPIAQWRWPVWSLVVGAVIFWVGAQDAAIFGGLATDLNSLSRSRLDLVRLTRSSRCAPRWLDDCPRSCDPAPARCWPPSRRAWWPFRWSRCR